jgi:arylsulfatase A-like enzyme
LGRNTNKVAFQTWEGGVKAAALIWSPLIKQSRAVFNKICSIQDWLPTLLSAIKSKAKPKGIDGQNIWPALNKPSQKTYSKILLQIDDIRNISAIREDDFKLLIGRCFFEK